MHQEQRIHQTRWRSVRVLAVALGYASLLLWAGLAFCAFANPVAHTMAHANRRMAVFFIVYARFEYRFAPSSQAMWSDVACLVPIWFNTEDIARLLPRLLSSSASAKSAYCSRAGRTEPNQPASLLKLLLLREGARLGVL